MTSQQFLVCDCSTVANFASWGHAISSFFATAGWVQTADTGQVNWSTISTVPGSNAYVYEIWKPGDALTVFYVRMEYGNNGAANSPAIRLSVGTGTNGAGTLTGFVIGPWVSLVSGSLTAPSTTTTYECDFSGDTGRIHVMLWRNAPNSVGQLFSVERSVNSSGAYTGSHVTLIIVGYSGLSNYVGNGQQTILFGVGPAPAVTFPTTNLSGNGAGLGARMFRAGAGIAGAFNGTIALDTVSPFIGYWDYPLTGVGLAPQPDYAEGVTFTVTLYGATRTYMPSKTANCFNFAGPFLSPAMLCMRYD